MNYDDFKKKYDNKPVDVDNYPSDNPYQCKDLANQYVMEVLDNPRLPWGDAHAMWNNYQSELYERIPNTADAVPRKGDIMIWGLTLGNGFGHIAIFDHGDVNSFVSFDQNWPVRSKCHLQPHSYDHVVGWLRSKKSATLPPMSTCEQQLEEARRFDREERVPQIKRLQTRINDDLSPRVNDLEAENRELNNVTIPALENKIELLTEEMDRKEDVITEKNKQIEILQQAVETGGGAAEDLKQTILSRFWKWLTGSEL